MKEIPVYRKDDIDINYVVEGNGEPLVLVQGFCCKLQSWHFQIQYFKERMKVIAMDIRGTGKSTRPDTPYTSEDLVEDLKDLLDHLEITEPVHLCGFSNGGITAELFTLKYPNNVKSLILIGTAHYIPQAEYESSLKMIKTISKLKIPQRIIIRMTLNHFFSEQFRKKLKKDKELKKLYKRDIGLVGHLQDRPRYKDYILQWQAIEGLDLRDSIENVSQPTLLIVGEMDKGNRSLMEEMAKLIQNSELKILDNSNHAVTIESHEITNNLIWEFISKN